MNQINNCYSRQSNYRNIQKGGYSIYPENTKQNTDLNEIFAREKQVIDNSIKELRREINEMSDNIERLNNNTNAYIRNKNYNLKHFRSYSNDAFNLPNQCDTFGDTQNNLMNNNLICNEYAYNTYNNFYNNNRNNGGINNFRYQNINGINKTYKNIMDNNNSFIPNQNQLNNTTNKAYIKRNKSKDINNRGKRLLNMQNNNNN